jgi:SAM-dependent methyltransferase
LDALQTVTLQRIGQIAEADAAPEAKMTGMLAALADYRSAKILQGLVERYGARVLSGPFEGMLLPRDEIMPLHIMGGYEHALIPQVERLIGSGYRRILNIGCSFGYYAVGFARRLPEATVEAFDIDPAARENCRRMAAENGVADRVTIGERFDGAMFERYRGERVLVLCDIEGGERDLLDPVAFPALAGMDILVELHDLIDPSLSTDIPARFGATHAVHPVPHASIQVPMPDSLWNANSLDQMVAVWEGRGGPTPWAVMLSRQPNGPA